MRRTFGALNLEKTQKINNLIGMKFYGRLNMRSNQREPVYLRISLEWLFVQLQSDCVVSKLSELEFSFQKSTENN